MNIDDFSARLQALMPPWFGEDMANLIAVIQGAAYVDNFIYSLLKYIRLQMRLNTMTDESLDMFAESFFGNKLLRHYAEEDDAYRKRISVALFRPGATRQAMIKVLTDLTGRVPVIWESGIDSSFYNHSFYGHGSYGTNNGAYQAWIIAYRPLLPASDGMSFYNHTSFYGNTYYSGLSTSSVTDQDILDAIYQTHAEGTLMHVTILN